jgi:methionine biosynthesis protein MetW
MALRPDLDIISQWITPGSRVLDLGCGDGTLLAHLWRTRQVIGYGLEIDPNKIVMSVAADVNVIQSDLNKGLSDMKENTFDYVVLTQTLQAVQHPDQLLREMLRVGRECIVTFPNFGHWRNRLQVGLRGKMPVSRNLPDEWFDTPNIHLCSVNDFEELCQLEDIKILQSSVVDHLHRSGPIMRMLPNLLSEFALYRIQSNRERPAVTND